MTFETPKQKTFAQEVERERRRLHAKKRRKKARDSRGRDLRKTPVYYRLPDSDDIEANE